jgi:hypothetical protein
MSASVHSKDGPGSRRRRSLAVVGALATSVLIGATMATPANAVLATTADAVGPATKATFGFPAYYKDAAGTKVNLCIDNLMCVGGDLPDPDAAPSLAGNFPDEAFYAYADAEVDLTQGGRIRWRAVIEGTWVNGDVVNGDQMTFARINFTGSKINTAAYPVGTKLTAKTPYGNMTATVAAGGKLIRNRQESDPGLVGDFTPPATDTVTDYGPKFLRWSGTLPVVDGVTYLGNPATTHAIQAGPSGLSSFQVFVGTAPASKSVTRFTVAGRTV